LRLAHTYARKAYVEAQKAEIKRTSLEPAREQHELAAGEFANARKGTTDLEVGHLKGVWSHIVPLNLSV